MGVLYRWFDYWGKEWHETACEVLSVTGKTAEIKLKAYGKGNAPPGTVMKCRIGSLVGYGDTPERQPQTQWKDYTYFS